MRSASSATRRRRRRRSAPCERRSGSRNGLVQHHGRTPRSACAAVVQLDLVCAAAMNFGHPLLLLTLLVIPMGVAPLPSRGRASADAVRRAVHERRRARGRRRERQAVAALGRGRRLPPRPRNTLRRGLASARAPPRRERQRDRRARARRLRLDAGDGREADTPRRSAAGTAHVPREGAAASQGRSRPLRRRGAGRDAADDRSRARLRGDRRGRLLPRLRRHRDRRRDRDRRPGRPALGGRAGELGERAAARARSSRPTSRREAAGEHARLDPLPLGRPPDARHPPAAPGRRQGARGGDPGLHRRARHDRQHDDARLSAGLRGGGPIGGGGGGFGRRGLAPDPKTLRAIADRTGGKFFRAKSAGAARTRIRRSARSSAASPARPR